MKIEENLRVSDNNSGFAPFSPFVFSNEKKEDFLQYLINRKGNLPVDESYRSGGSSWMTSHNIEELPKIIPGNTLSAYLMATSEASQRLAAFNTSPPPHHSLFLPPHPSLVSPQPLGSLTNHAGLQNTRWLMDSNLDQNILTHDETMTQRSGYETPPLHTHFPAGCGKPGSRCKPEQDSPAETDAGQPSQSLLGSLVVLCTGCERRITEKFYLAVDGSPWHPACLQCCECGNMLEKHSSCFMRQGNIYCKDDYFRKFVHQPCARCLGPLKPRELVMRARGALYHPSCFACSHCAKILLTGEEFGMRDGHLFCRLHFQLHEGLPPTNSLSPSTMPPPFLFAGNDPGSFPPSKFHTNNEDAQLPGMPPTSAIPSVPAKLSKGRPRKRKVSQQVPPPPCDIISSDPYLNPYPPGITDLQPSDPMGLFMNGGTTLEKQQQRNAAAAAAHAKRVRTSFKNHQLRVLKQYFLLNHNPDAKELKQLSQKTSLSKRVLQVWFQNARAKYRRTLVKNQNGSKEENSKFDLDEASQSPGGTMRGEDTYSGSEDEGLEDYSPRSHDNEDEEMEEDGGCITPPISGREKGVNCGNEDFSSQFLIPGDCF